MNTPDKFSFVFISIQLEKRYIVGKELLGIICCEEVGKTTYLRDKVKVKVKLSLCLTKNQAMKTYGGTGDISPGIPDLGTRLI
jgi:hypothetical protein